MGEHDVTMLLQAIGKGDRSAMDRLVPLLYDEIREIAARHMARERKDHTLQPTALVNEAYMRLIDRREPNWENRAHFLGADMPGEAEGEIPVTLSGVALCKVDAGFGSIRPGDLLTTSPTPGHAMRSDEPLPGTIVGKALEPLEHGTGLVRVLVTLR